MCVLTNSLGQWLIRAADNHRLGSGARLEAMDAKNLAMLVEVALRMKDKIAKSPDDTLRWIKGLNQGPSTKNWMVLDRLREVKR
jgi:hypothetical protein